MTELNHWCVLGKDEDDELSKQLVTNSIVIYPPRAERDERSERHTPKR